MYKKLIAYSNKIFNLFSIIASITDERLKPQIDTVKIVAAIVIMQFTNLGSLNSLSQEIAYKNFKKEIPSVSTNMVSKVKWGVIRFLVLFYPLFV